MPYWSELLTTYPRGFSTRPNYKWKDIHRRSGITNISKRISSLKWQPISRKTDFHCSRKVLARTLQIGKRSVGRPVTRCWDDLVKAAGSRWKQTASNWGNLRLMSSSQRLTADIMMIMTWMLFVVFRNHSEGLAQDLAPTRAWERELGDWWDHTPLLPGISRYFDAADLLLRLRAMSVSVSESLVGSILFIVLFWFTDTVGICTF